MPINPIVVVGVNDRAITAFVKPVVCARNDEFLVAGRDRGITPRSQSAMVS